MTVVSDSGIQWLEALPRFGIRPGLERTQRVLRALGNPEDGLNFYHVAGTNGKGSVCAFLHSLLSVHRPVGLFTSPAYDGFRARFRIGDDSIDMADFSRLAEAARTTADRVTPQDPITEFEALTVMAILYFAERGVADVVWETGLGGRYDSTNVVTPVVTAITNVSLDHTEILGDTIRKIAADKSGIIKAGVPMVTTATDVALMEIRAAAKREEAPLICHGTNFSSTRLSVGATLQSMAYRGLTTDLYDVHVPLFGVHQCTNAALAIAVVETAMQCGHTPAMTSDDMCAAIARTRWPGRFEQVAVDGVPVVLDGAHNAAGAGAFAAAISEYTSIRCPQTNGWTMVVGVLADKDVRMMLHQLLPFAAKVVAVTPANARAMSAHHLAEEIRAVRADVEVVVADSVKDGVDIALEQNQGEPICCWGSLYTVDEARKALQGHHTPLVQSTTG